MIYFLHIPKTSGSSIFASVLECFSNTLSIPKEHETYQMDDLLNPNQNDFETFLQNSCSKYDFFYGHYATSPYSFASNIETFSIIREPFDRFMSCFRFLQKNGTNFSLEQYDWKESELKLMEEFMTTPFYNTGMGFDSRPNMQSANLINQIEWIDGRHSLGTPDTSHISFEELLKIIKINKITLSTFDNRSYLIDELEINLNKIKNTNLQINRELKRNFDIRPKIDYKKFLKKDLIQKIKNKNKLDYYLYYYVKEFELKNKRCLSYKDILSN